MSVLPFPGTTQTEIFGRFILVCPVGEQERGPQTFRALDLDRELRPLVAVTRLPPWGTFDRKEQIAFVAAAEHHSVATDEAVAGYVDHGVIDGVPWRASEWVNGVSVAQMLAAFGPDDRRELPSSFTTSVAYIVGSTLLSSKTAENILVTAQPRPRRVILHFDGAVSVLGPALQLSRPSAEEARYHPEDAEHVDSAHLARLFFELSTGLPWAGVAAVDQAGPRGRVPAEIVRLTKLAAAGRSPLRDFVMQLQPLMHAASGGNYSHIAEILRRFCPDAEQESARRSEKELALARRLRARRLPRPKIESANRVTREFRIRPASQEGPAVVEVFSAPPPEMCLIAGGRFLFLPVDESPGYVDVKPFLLDRNPVTCGEYARFCQATRHPPPTYWPVPVQLLPDPDNLTDALRDTPVVGVSRDDAEAYAAWAHKRLPTEVEWELAARGFDGRLWPWGNDFDEDLAGTAWREALEDRAPVPLSALNPKALSPFGIAALGSCWEWTSTPAGELASSSWIVRGGTWRDRTEPPMLLNRSFEDRPASDLGFRCAADVARDEVDEDDLTPI